MQLNQSLNHFNIVSSTFFYCIADYNSVDYSEQWNLKNIQTLKSTFPTLFFHLLFFKRKKPVKGERRQQKCDSFKFKTIHVPSVIVTLWGCDWIDWVKIRTTLGFNGVMIKMMMMNNWTLISSFGILIYANVWSVFLFDLLVFKKKRIFLHDEKKIIQHIFVVVNFPVIFSFEY